MTPELEAILDEIGWTIAKRCSPWLAAKWINSLSQTGGKLGAGPQDSKELAVKMNKLFNAMVDVMRQLDEVPAGLRRSINLASTSKEEMLNLFQKGEENFPDFIESFQGGFWSLAPGIEATLSRLELEAGPKKKGRPRNEVAFSVAATVLEIFIVGLGIVPSAGRRSDGRGLSGPYGKAVEQTYAALGVIVSDAHDQCEEALGKLDHERLAGLLLLRCPVTRHHAEFEFGNGTIAV